MRILKCLPSEVDGVATVVSEPYRTTFRAFETIDLDGIQVTIEQSGRTPIMVGIEELRVYPQSFDNNSGGTQYVDITYRNTVTIKYPVTIEAHPYTRIHVGFDDRIPILSWGKEFSKSDLEVYGFTADGDIYRLPNDSLEFSIEEGEVISWRHRYIVDEQGQISNWQTVTHTPSGLTYQFPLGVADTMMYTGIASNPTLLKYYYNEPLDYTGLKVNIYYNGGEESYVEEYPYEWLGIDPPEGTLVKERSVKVTVYRGVTDEEIGHFYVSCYMPLAGYQVNFNEIYYSMGDHIDAYGSVTRMYPKRNMGVTTEYGYIESVEPNVVTEDMIVEEGGVKRIRVTVTDDKGYVNTGNYLYLRE